MVASEMESIEIVLLGSLGFFAPRCGGHGSMRVPCRPRSSLKDTLEAAGVPHPEIGRVEIDGRDAGLDARPRPGARVVVHPYSPDPADPSRPPRFVLDVHLGRLAWMLRLLGFDARYGTGWDDPELARISAREGRILLTRDRGLLKWALVRQGYCLRSTDSREQLREVAERYGLARAARPWTRCMRCNGLVEPAPKKEIEELLQPKTRLFYQEFRRCRDCGKIYWKGSHYPKLQAVLAQLGIPPEDGTIP